MLQAIVFDLMRTAFLKECRHFFVSIKGSEEVGPVIATFRLVKDNIMDPVCQN